MAIAGTKRYTGGMVDLAAGQISRDIFVSDEIYQQELERVFVRGWLFVGHEIENYEWDGLRIPGTVMDVTDARSSEHNLRNFYRRWAEFMDAESWDDLATWRRRDA